MGNLRAEVETLRKEVTQFREALELLENPPQRYGPKPGEIPLLDFLKLEVAAARDVKEREKLLAISRQSLTNAEQHLAFKQEELSQLQSDCEAIACQMKQAGERVVSAESAYRQSLADFETLAAKHQRRWQELNPGRELYRQLCQVDFPGFVITDCCGILTTAAIAKDLRR